MTEPVLEVSHLSVAFGAAQVLADLTLRVPWGSALAVIGPNGAGKTVLFRALIGALPYRGHIRWAAGTRIGYVPQQLDVERDVPITGLDLLRARESLAPHAGVAQVAVAASSATAAVSATAAALDLVGVPSEVAAQRIGALSGGQFQRLLVAAALVGEPTVLLLDEPTAGVDEPGQEQLNQLVHRLQRERGLTVLFISHDLAVVYRYATDVLCLGRRLACSGPPRTILTPELLQAVYGVPLAFHVHDLPDASAPPQARQRPRAVEAVEAAEAPAGGPPESSSGAPTGNHDPTTDGC